MLQALLAFVCLLYLSVAKHIRSTPNLPTNIVDFSGFDSSIILIFRGGIPMPIGDFPESLSQAMLVGVMLVRRLGVFRKLQPSVLLLNPFCISTLGDRESLIPKGETKNIYIYIYVCIYIYIYIYTHLIPRPNSAPRPWPRAQK